MAPPPPTGTPPRKRPQTSAAARIGGSAAARADRPRPPRRGPPGPGGPRAEDRRQAAVDDAQDDRGAAARGEDDGPALLPDRRHRHGRRDGVPRAGRAGPRRQAVGQRPGAQGVRARAAQGAGGNASFTEEAIIQHARVDIGMAVAIEDGLVTPVIRDADKKTIGQIGSEAARAGGARARPQAASPTSTRARPSRSRTSA